MRKSLFAAVTVALIAVAGFAQGHGPGMRAPGMAGPGTGGPEMGRGDGPGFGAGLVVASDGTVFIVTEVPGTTPGTGTTTIMAVRPTGTTAWTATLANGHGRLELSGSNLLSVAETKATDGTFSSTITAISTTSGATAWSKTIAGHVGGLTPFSGGTYAVVVVPATTSGAAATRSLVAIGNDGSILWTVALP
jgi:hypothetical protein